MNHTAACVLARGGAPDEYPRLGDLSVKGVRDVLACPHEAHDVIRVYAGALSKEAAARNQAP